MLEKIILRTKLSDRFVYKYQRVHVFLGSLIVLFNYNFIETNKLKIIP